ncbi:MAG TPA: hypothetical protein VIB39_01565, partial [Candidatus Angelobacter sp.]
MTLPQVAFAQTAAAEKLVANSSTPSGAGPASSPTDAGRAHANANAELIKELEQMRRRIEQLEAQLKAQSEAKQQPAVAGEATLLTTSAAAPSSVTMQPKQTAAANQQPKTEKEKPADPFAFADWTWLNGNPRTKEPAF